MKSLEKKIRNVPDFPKKGIEFKDITTLIKDAQAFRQAIDELAKPYLNQKIDLIVGVEARGFIFASALAYKFGAGVVPIRKPGKLPAETIRAEYQLEYGTDAIEIHRDAIQPGQKVLVVDDLLATGGTIAATLELVQKLGGEVVGVSFLIELDFLHGREKLKNYPIHSIVHYQSE